MLVRKYLKPFTFSQKVEIELDFLSNKSFEVEGWKGGILKEEIRERNREHSGLAIHIR